MSELTANEKDIVRQYVDALKNSGKQINDYVAHRYRNTIVIHYTIKGFDKIYTTEI